MAPGRAAVSTRPAHPPGPTFLGYTPNGRKLVTVGSNNTIRIFDTGSDGEPTNVDDTTDSNTAVVVTNEFFITGSEDGTVCKYSLETNLFEEVLVRCTLPIRDLCLSPDRQWVAVASDELAVKIVNVHDMTRVKFLREQSKPIKHVAFDYSGNYLLASCTDGILYIYDMTSDEPELLKKVDGLIRALDSEAQDSAQTVWHPDGRAFAAPTATRDVQVVSKRDWEHQRVFKNTHSGGVTAMSWSPNGALLVTAGTDRTICLWDTKTQKNISKLDDLKAPIWAFSWHPTQNMLSYTNAEGEVLIHQDFVPAEHATLLEKDLEPAPFIHDPLSEISGNATRQPTVNGIKDRPPVRSARQGTPDSLDEILGPEDDEDSDLDGFVEDDDGLGYAEQVNGNGKRTSNHLDGIQNGYTSKRRAVWQPQIHEAFQPGSTPWRGARRYLSLNLLGFVWTVDQETHHTVTVEFYDREFNRDFHFTDPFSYDKACLSEKGTLFSCQPRDDQPSMLYYRPHETWTTRADWRTELPKGESITSIALGDSYVVATTSANYVRIYTLFGTPVRVYRHKSSPIVTCASWRDYVLTMGNGAAAADGTTQLLYSIENVKRDEPCQAEDAVALPPGGTLASVFFSDAGDPCIYDSDGVLLVLQHWRTPGAARWAPLLDTRTLARLAGGNKTEAYWPVAVANARFYCIILKGGDRYPYFPRPLLSEFDFAVPLRDAPAAAAESDDAQTRTLEEAYVRTALLHSLHEDQLAATSATAAQRAALGARALELDKTLLQLLAAECVEGEERGMKALEIVRLMRDGSGRMLEAAMKIAGRFGRDVLRGKIEELMERRAVGLDDDVDE